MPQQLNNRADWSDIIRGISDLRINKYFNTRAEEEAGQDVYLQWAAASSLAIIIPSRYAGRSLSASII